jgi:hypothetical protein
MLLYFVYNGGGLPQSKAVAISEVQQNGERRLVRRIASSDKASQHRSAADLAPNQGLFGQWKMSN